MCNGCDQTDIQVLQRTRRRRLWEMETGAHCSVIGTCLTLAELRALARKLALRMTSDLPVDYEIHGYFAHAAKTQGKVAKMLNKALDKRHAGAIRKVRALDGPDGLLAFWDEALASGDVAGAYWALLTHPLADAAISARLFADVHMLSHLVGASNRADIRKLNGLERENTDLQDRLDRLQGRHADRLVEKDREIGRLKADLARAGDAVRPQAAETVADAAIAQRDALKREVEAAEAAAAQARTEAENAERRFRALELRIDEQSEEILALTTSLEAGLPALGGDAAGGLDGALVLYVGGRDRAQPRMRQVIEAFGGRFEHHDGGVERSVGELAAAVQRSDLVVFPTDCVSHSAVATIKKLCRQSMTPFVALRSCGVGSVVAGLRRHCDGRAMPLAAE